MAATDSRRLAQYLQTAARIHDGYRGSEPFARYLTGYFRANRQMGSRDRRMAARLVYNVFRMGRAMANLPFHQRAVLADFLCGEDARFVNAFEPSLLPWVGGGLDARIAAAADAYGFRLSDVFPFAAYLSPSLDREAFVTSHLIQPELFLRMRHGSEMRVKNLLTQADIAFREVGSHGLALPSGTPVDQVKGLRGHYEVQDLSSQQTAAYMAAGPGESWWDACAGSGGKSLLLLDREPGVKLLVSDTRLTILRNLNERFDQAGIRSYRQKIIDVAKSPETILGDERFDGIIVDAPCTGSGTWGRAPEMLARFQPQRIDYFVSLQQDIVFQAAKFLRPGRPLVYITCSAFEAENEGIVKYMEATCGLRAERIDMLHGYTHRADTMFVARLVRV